MDSSEYIENIKIVVDTISKANSNAKFVFISPWLALENDPYTKLDAASRDDMLAEFGQALATFCEANGHLFIDPNPGIYNELLASSSQRHLLDHIHPNASAGIDLYSEKVIEYRPSAD